MDICDAEQSSYSSSRTNHGNIGDALYGFFGILISKNDGEKNALKSAVYTGIAYLTTVIILITPYAIFPDKSFAQALIMMLGLVIFIIALSIIILL